MTLIDKMYKVHLDDGDKRVIDLVKEAQKIGRKAAKEQLAKLEKAGSRWALKDAFTGRSAGTMLDCCGFGSLTIPGNGKIVKAFKKLGRKEGECSNVTYHIDDMRIGKAYQRGYHLNLRLTYTQYLSVNERAVQEASDFLSSMGLKCEWSSRID